LLFAEEHGVVLSYVAGVDLSCIETPMPGRVGGSAYKRDMEVGLRRKAKAVQRRLLAQFEKECSARNLSCVATSFEGDPVVEILTASALNDLLIVGHDIAFCGAPMGPGRTCWRGFFSKYRDR
jgi:hypothetical protein